MPHYDVRRIKNRIM